MQVHLGGCKLQKLSFLNDFQRDYTGFQENKVSFWSWGRKQSDLCWVLTESWPPWGKILFTDDICFPSLLPALFHPFSSPPFLSSFSLICRDLPYLKFCSCQIAHIEKCCILPYTFQPQWSFDVSCFVLTAYKLYCIQNTRINGMEFRILWFQYSFYFKIGIWRWLTNHFSEFQLFLLVFRDICWNIVEIFIIKVIKLNDTVHHTSTIVLSNI